MEKYAFVDMHIHTEWSNENKCDASVDAVLEKAQKKAEKSGRDCVIAIADHNTILGSKLAKEILSSKEGKEKYPNVKLISGIEFTTDLCEMRQHFDNKTSFTRCHTLAYGFDVNNKELIAYSKITHKQFNSEDNVGLQICSARRAIIDNLGIRLPYYIFENLVNLNKKTNFRKEFLEVVKEYSKEKKLNININNVEKIISPYLDLEVGYNRQATAYGRIWLSELAKIVKDAGGQLVIAHPSLLKINIEGIEYIAQKEKINVKDIYEPSSYKYNKSSDISHIKKQKLVMDYFLNTFEKICGYKVLGIEKNYASNFKPRIFNELSQLCVERNLYETAGSDYHGEHLHVSKKIAHVFNDDMQMAVKEVLEYKTESVLPLVVQYTNSADYLLNNNKEAIKNKTIYGLDTGEVISSEVFNKLICTTKPVVDEKKIEPVNNNQEKISNLNYIIEKLDYILNINYSPKKQAKLLLKLNQYAESVYSGLVKMKFLAEKEYFDKEYNQIVDLIEIVNEKLNKLYTSSPKLQKGLLSDMKYYYKRKKIALEQITKLQLPENKNQKKNDELDR